MIMTPVESSCISHVGYSPEDRVLRVLFKNSGLHDYFDVPPEAHHALMKADSLGKHFGSEIRNKYGSAKVPPGFEAV